MPKIHGIFLIIAFSSFPIQIDVNNFIPHEWNSYADLHTHTHRAGTCASNWCIQNRYVRKGNVWGRQVRKMFHDPRIESTVLHDSSGFAIEYLHSTNIERRTCIVYLLNEQINKGVWHEMCAHSTYQFFWKYHYIISFL